MKKKLLTLLCVLTCVLSLTACGSERQYTDLEQQKISNCETLATYSLQLVSTIGPENAQNLFDSYNKAEMKALYEAQMQSYGLGAEAKLGAFDGLLTSFNQMVSDMDGVTSTGEYTSEIIGKEIVVTVPVYGNSCDGQIVFTFSNDVFCTLKQGDATANTSFSQKMEEAGSHMGDAGLNTILGMGSVFLVLILISLIIASFGLFKKKPEVKKQEVKQVESAPSEESEDLTDDTELVAVIAAAIRAYEGAGAGSADGFVVRSIKKANRRN